MMKIINQHDYFGCSVAWCIGHGENIKPVTGTIAIHSNKIARLVVDGDFGAALNSARAVSHKWPAAYDVLLSHIEPADEPEGA